MSLAALQERSRLPTGADLGGDFEIGQTILTPPLQTCVIELQGVRSALASGIGHDLFEPVRQSRKFNKTRVGSQKNNLLLF
jgi:hypothetical protein